MLRSVLPLGTVPKRNGGEYEYGLWNCRERKNESKRDRLFKEGIDRRRQEHKKRKAKSKAKKAKRQRAGVTDSKSQSERKRRGRKGPQVREVEEC